MTYVVVNQGIEVYRSKSKEDIDLFKKEWYSVDITTEDCFDFGRPYNPDDNEIEIFEEED